MRARRFELRSIALMLLAAWALAGVLVLLAYRPGGPFDIVVGLTMLLPAGVAAAAVVWPPVTRGDLAYRWMVALGVGALLVLLPSIGGVVNQLAALGSQTLLPSLEAAYPWALALAGTCLFTGFGVARRLEGAMAVRSRRLRVGAAVALALLIPCAGAFAGAAIANELALRERPAATASRFGPTDPQRIPGTCDEPIAAAPAARISADYDAVVDLRPIGTVDLVGLRVARDMRWLAYVATDLELGQYGAARRADRAWTRTPRTGWISAPTATVQTATVDLQAIETALTPDFRTTAEDRGIEVIEGAPARRCRVAVDGGTFRRAFPQIRWLVGDADIERWRGQIDYWIFLDGQIGQIAGSANGEAAGIDPQALQATVDVHLTVTERDRDLVIYPPAP